MGDVRLSSQEGLLRAYVPYEQDGGDVRDSREARIAEQLRAQVDSGSPVDGHALLELISNLRQGLRADLSLEPPAQPAASPQPDAEQT